MIVQTKLKGIQVIPALIVTAYPRTCLQNSGGKRRAPPTVPSGSLRITLARRGHRVELWSSYQQHRGGGRGAAVAAAGGDPHQDGLHSVPVIDQRPRLRTRIYCARFMPSPPLGETSTRMVSTASRSSSGDYGFCTR
jgi:hypothetical protein